MISPFLFFWQQQKNIDDLNQDAGNFKTDIQTLKTSIVKQKANSQKELKQQLSVLEKQLNALPDKPASKQPLNRQISTLRNQIEALPEPITVKDPLSLEKDRLILEKDMANAKNAIWGSVFQALGGLFFLITVVISLLNYQATQDKQISERFSKAVELLGNTNLGVRLGGIYALERLANDSSEDYWSVMQILAGFVRDRSLLRKAEETQSTFIQTMEEKDKRSLPPTDIQAALLILDRYVEDSQNRKSLDLRGSDFSDMTLSPSLKEVFREMNLTNTNFQKADLSGADLSGANLSREQIKSACHWDQAIYAEANWNETDLIWVASDEQANQGKIQEIKKDKASDPKEPPDCSKWES